MNTNLVQEIQKAYPDLMAVDLETLILGHELVQCLQFALLGAHCPLLSFHEEILLVLI